MGFKDTFVKKAGEKAAQLATQDKEYRRNVFRTDDQRMAAFYFSPENLKQAENGCFTKKKADKKGCFNKESAEAFVLEKKPYFDDAKKGCFKKNIKHSMTDAEYDALVRKMLSNMKEQAIEALLIDPSEIEEVAPIHFSKAKIYNEEALKKLESPKIKIGDDLICRSHCIEDTWIFFTSNALLAYQHTFYTDNNSSTETTYEFNYNDITSIKVIEDVAEEIDKNGHNGQTFKKSLECVVTVPNDSLRINVENDNEQINSIKAMKTYIREKKNK